MALKIILTSLFFFVLISTSDAKLSRKRMTNVVVQDGHFIDPGTFHFQKALYHYNKGHKDTALNRFMLAAEFNNKKAIKYISAMYLIGDGVTKDTTLGLAWLKISSYHGNTESKKIFEDITQDYNSDQLLAIEDAYLNLKEDYSKEAILNNAYRYYRRFQFQTLDKPNTIQQTGRMQIVLSEKHVMDIAKEIRGFYLDIKNNYGDVTPGEIIPVDD